MSVIDGKRAQNLSILLSSKLNKQTFEEIKKAIFELNETILTGDITKQLVNYVSSNDVIVSHSDVIIVG